MEGEILIGISQKTNILLKRQKIWEYESLGYLGEALSRQSK